MPSSYSALWYHAVFATKDRRPWLEPALRGLMHAYLGGIAREFHGVCRAIGGSDDHVHLLVSLPQDLSVADAMRIMKTNSSRWLHRKRPHLQAAGWQDGYSAFTVSVSQLDRVESYILGQGEHHRTLTFGDELRRLLDRHGVRYQDAHLPP
jgi:REP element-mobilizing transposase RayT